jgi:dihydrofolate reductase
MSDKMFNLIVAMNHKGIIGRDNNLPWHIPEDLQYVKQMTMNKVIIMGRKNYESIGRPLPNRENIILTRDTEYVAEGCTIYHTVNDIMRDYQHRAENVFIFGGAEIYKLFLPYVHRMYITTVYMDVKGDIYFPTINGSEWIIEHSEYYNSTNNDIPCAKIIFKRR